jgi:hypothetical protein
MFRFCKEDGKTTWMILGPDGYREYGLTEEKAKDACEEMNAQVETELNMDMLDH